MVSREPRVNARAGSLARVLLVLAVLGVWAALAVFFWYEATKGWTSEKVEQAIRAELPSGSTRKQVQEWLDSHEFSNSTSTPDRSGPWAVREAGLDPGQVGVEILANVPDPNVDWGDLGGRGRMSVTFFFDKGDRLLGHLILVFVKTRDWPWNWLLPPWWLLVGFLLFVCAGVAFLVGPRGLKGLLPARRPSWITTRRLVICLALVVSACIAFLFIYSDLKRRGPFWDKYQKVQPRMTQQEVEAILGPPMYEEDFGGMGSDHACSWKERQQTINVYFNAVRRDGYGVIKKEFFPKTMWERMWDR